MDNAISIYNARKKTSKMLIKVKKQKSILYQRYLYKWLIITYLIYTMLTRYSIGIIYIEILILSLGVQLECTLHHSFKWIFKAKWFLISSEIKIFYSQVMSIYVIAMWRKQIFQVVKKMRMKEKLDILW